MYKCLYIPSSTDESNKKFLLDKEKFLLDNDTLLLDINKLQFYNEWKHNELHIATESHYNYIMVELGKFLSFRYDKNDFFLFEKKDRTGKFDISYLLPKRNKKFTVTYQDKQYRTTYEGLIGFYNYDKCVKNFMENTNFSDINPDYHLLFFASHQCCIIENNGKNNGRTLIISGDSQLIPDIPILAYYFKKIVYLDKRKGDFGNILFTISKEDEILYEMSKYSLEKYTEINFKKCKYI